MHNSRQNNNANFNWFDKVDQPQEDTAMIIDRLTRENLLLKQMLNSELEKARSQSV